MQRRYFALALSGGLALAQQQTITIERKITGAAGKEPTVFFMASDSASVKGVPYSADRGTETIQVLADGNRIVNGNKSSIARDGEGRTRLETQIQHFGPVGAAKEPSVSIHITDPVAKASYTLDATNKIAYKSAWGDMAAPVRMNRRGAPGETVTEDVVVERNVVERKVTATITHGAPAIAGTAGVWVGSGAPAIASTMASPIRMMNFRGAGGPGEDLGEKNFEGVIAKGTKHVVKIAAGSIGNERELEIVTETWFSDQLKETVYTRHADPRFGETITKLTNIKLGEPPSSLFEVPADYKVESAHNMRMPMPTVIRD